MESSESSRLHNQIDQLECHLSAAEILHTHNTPYTLAFIKHTQSDVEQASAVMTKVTRTAGRRMPPLTEAEWRDLLNDLLEVRTKVYQQLKPDSVQEVRVHRTMCSTFVFY